jgi:DNA-directed RNA polymerase subunit K/omega
MIKPSITDLTKNEFNRYTLSIATAKCARMITDEYVRQREIAEHRIANKETDKSIASMIKKEYRDEKAVKVAVKKLYDKDFVIVGYTDKDLEEEKTAEAEIEE